MATIKGPLMSIDASGKIGEAMVFSTWKGRSYVRKQSIPKDPKTDGQVGMRTILGFLSRNWADILPVVQETWQPPAAATNTSRFNAYMKTNVERWRNFLGPGMQYPVPGTGVAPISPVRVLDARVRSILVVIPTVIKNNLWGYAIFRSLSTGFSTSFDNLIAIPPESAPSGSVNYLDTPLDPGEYFYNFRSLTTQGSMGPELGEKSAVVV